jgi:hypothetical protein
MKLSYLTTFCLSFVLLCLVNAQQENTISVSENHFEGKIHFKKMAGSVEMKYNYFVKGNQVRIEELNELNEVVGIQLVNTKNKKLIAISPERKLYLEAPTRRSGANLDVKVVKTERKKIINGIECSEIIVINKAQDRKIRYWVAAGNYSFFNPLLQVLNRKEKQALYFLKIRDIENCWAMKSVEFVISTGKVVSKLITLSIDNSEQNEVLFEIPEDYIKFEN